MTQIVLTEEQTKLLSLTEAVQICDPQGHVIVVIPPELTTEELAKLRRANDCKDPMVTSAQVKQALQKLEEAWQGEGPFDLTRAREIVKQLRATGDR